ncbi:MAG: C40 family peptidase [Sulfuricellaceae bacterium]|nr:C40 family peptidase [Sulfuricellaceae bacterium]
MGFIKIIYLGCAFFFSAAALAQEESTDLEPQSAAFSSTVQTRHQAGISDTLEYALKMVGVNYKYGGRSPSTGFDCSGFVGHVFHQVAGLSLPHNALAISRQGKQITANELRPGDLVFYNTLRRSFSHVGIYLGNKRFVHAPSHGRGVEVVDMQDKYWSTRFNGARRIFSLQLPPGLTAE